MALEDLTGTKYIDDLNSSNPAAGDNVSEGDDHIRGIKNVLKTTFPNIDGAVNATDTDLSNVLPTTGGTLTGDLNLGDDVDINVGDSTDLKIYHEAAGHNYVDASTDCNILIRNLSDNRDILLQSDDGSGGLVNYVQVDGSNGQVRLYHYGDEKFNTASTGIEVTGDAAITGDSSGSTVLTLTSNALADTPLMVFQRTGGAVAGKLAYEDSNTAIAFGTTTSHELKLLANNTRAIQINSGGDIIFYDDGGDSEDFYWDAEESRLGIGDSASTPDARLEIRDTGSVKTLYVVDNDNVCNQSAHTLYINKDISGSDTCTTPRTHTGVRVDIDSSATGGDTSNEHRIYGIYNTLNATGDSDLQYAAYNYVKAEPSAGQVTTVKGAYNYAIGDPDSGASVTKVFGSHNSAYAQGAGDITTIYGANSWANIDSNYTGSNVSTAFGVLGEVEMDAAGTLDNAYGVSSIIDRNAGTITNGYLFHGDYQGTEPTNAYGVYIVDDVKNYFEGNVGIGTNNPSRLQHGSIEPKLHMLQSSTTGTYNLVSRFEAGTDADNTGASILINHSNDRGLLIEAGRQVGDVGIAHLGIVSAGGTNTRVMTLKQGGNVGIGTDDPAKPLHITGASGDITADMGNGTILQIDGGSISTTNHGVGLAFVRTGSQMGFIKAARENTSDEAGFLSFASQTSGGTHPERMRIDSSGNVGIGVTPEAWRDDYTALQIGAKTSLTDVANRTRHMNNAYEDAALDMLRLDTSLGAVRYEQYDGEHLFKVAPAGTGDIGWITAMTLDNSGDVLMCDSADLPNASYGGAGWYNDSSYSRALLMLGHTDTSSRHLIQFFAGSSTTRVGFITCSPTTVEYNTGSDYRLKENVVPMTGSIDRLKSLKPSRFNFIIDADKTVDGFLAHEVSDYVPEAISGEKDAMQTKEYTVSEALGEVFTPAVEEVTEERQVTETVETGSYVNLAGETITETQEVGVTEEVTETVVERQDIDGVMTEVEVERVTQEPVMETVVTTEAVAEVILETDVEKPEELTEGQWRETTAKVTAEREVIEPQGIDQSKLVPLLVGALQEAIARIEELESKV